MKGKYVYVRGNCGNCTIPWAIAQSLLFRFGVCPGHPMPRNLDELRAKIEQVWEDIDPDEIRRQRKAKAGNSKSVGIAAKSEKPRETCEDFVNTICEIITKCTPRELFGILAFGANSPTILPLHIDGHEV
jgi:hypothetical protein